MGCTLVYKTKVIYHAKEKENTMGSDTDCDGETVTVTRCYASSQIHQGYVQEATISSTLSSYSLQRCLLQSFSRL